MKKLFICLFCVSPFVLLFSCSKKSDSGGSTVIVAPPVNTSKIYYVATTGDDSRTAAQAKSGSTPWKTIQKAANSISGCDTVIIAGGTYSESITLTSRLNGSAVANTLFKSKDGEIVTIEGGISNPNSNVVRWLSQFNISGVQYLTVKGISVQNVNWYAISVEGSSANITIDNCNTFNSGASGIYVKSCNNINLLNNKIKQACQVTTRDASGNGTQECITITSSNNFKVNGNEVAESTVNGSVGGEGIDIKGGSHDGEISNNYIHDIVPLGIYVDAGSGEEYNIRVFANRAYNTGGISVAGELGGHAHEIYFYNNVIKDSKSSGLVFQSIGNGKYTNVYVVNNTFYNNAVSGSFVGEIGNYSTNTGSANIQIRNNIIYNKGANYKFSIWHNLASTHVISNNLYFDFKPSNNAANSFTTANLTAADVNGTDPLFVNATSANFALQATSPAINKGIPITLPSSTTLLFTTDITGKSKGTSNWDMGAYEF